LAVSDHHRRTADSVEQGRVAGVVVVCLQGCVALRGDLGGVEGVEGGIPSYAGAGPLGVEGCLGVGGEVLGCGELLFERFDGKGRELAFTWEPWGAASLCLVGKVDCVALPEEVGCPAFTAVGCVEPVLRGINDGVAKEAASETPDDLQCLFDHFRR
jgi:hypothetical protein